VHGSAVIAPNIVKPQRFRPRHADRLGRIFLRDENGRRPVYGGCEKFQSDPHWRDYILFYEKIPGTIERGGKVVPVENHKGATMTKTKCPVCLKEHGRRSCQLREGALICSKCCAEMRNPDCAGCPYYAEAEKYAAQKIKKSDFRHFTVRIDPGVDEAVDHALTFAEKGDLTTAH
jgi:hypothetical protein